MVPDRCYAELDIRILPGQESMAIAIAEFLEQQQVPQIRALLPILERLVARSSPPPQEAPSPGEMW